LRSAYAQSKHCGVDTDSEGGVLLFLIPTSWVAVVTLCATVCRTAARGDETPAGLAPGASGPFPDAPSLLEAQHSPGAVAR
jgi:hypothetical protein